MDLQSKLNELEQQKQGLLLQVTLLQELAKLDGKIELLREMLREEKKDEQPSQPVV